MSFTAKSVILDCADSIGGAGWQFIRIRSVEFKLTGTLVDVADADITCYATTDDPVNNAAEFAFITTLSKIGTRSYTEWSSTLNEETDQRLICVFDTPIEFDEIVINNSHSAGSSTLTGAKNVKINISTDTITSTVYDEAIANSTLVFDGAFAVHVASNEIDDQTLSLLADTELTVPAFESTSELDAFVFVGDQLTVPAFSTAQDITATTQIQIPVTLESTGSLSATLSGGVIVLDIPTFEAASSLSSNILNGLLVSELGTTQDFSATLWTGYFLDVEPFEHASDIAASILLEVVTPAFGTTSELVSPLINQQLAVTPFESASSLVAGNITIFQYDNPSILYYFILTGSEDSVADVTIPISSFQARHRSGNPTYLSVVIPGTDYDADIAARPNGQMIIQMAKAHEGVVYHSEEILRVDLEEIRPDTGSRNKSVTLTGHGTTTFTSKIVALQSVSYRSGAAGKLRFRLATPDIFLRPGDTATYSSDSITVDNISYSVSPQSQTMEIAE